MKKSSLFLTGCAIAVLALFNACGNGGSSALKLVNNDYPQNAIFGDLFGVLYQYHQNDSILRTWYSGNRERMLNTLTEKNRQKVTDKVWELQRTKEATEAKLKEDFHAAIEKGRENIIGRQIPFETRDGLWYEANDFVVSKLADNGDMFADLTFTIVDAETAMGMTSFHINYLLLDSKGEVIKRGNTGRRRLQGEITEGKVETTTIQIPVKPKNAKELFDVAKFCFIP